MKNIVLSAALSLTAASAFANGATNDIYHNGFKPHGDLSAVVTEVPQTKQLRAAKDDDSVKFAYNGDRDGAAYNTFPQDNSRARFAGNR